jgi:hypothetical protein
LKEAIEIYNNEDQLSQVLRAKMIEPEEIARNVENGQREIIII